MLNHCLHANYIRSFRLAELGEFGARYIPGYKGSKVWPNISEVCTYVGNIGTFTYAWSAFRPPNSIILNQLTQRIKVCYPISTQLTNLPKSTAPSPGPEYCPHVYLPLPPVFWTQASGFWMSLQQARKTGSRMGERRRVVVGKTAASWGTERKKKLSLGQGKEFGELKDRSLTTVILDKVPSCLPHLGLPGRWP